MREVPPPYAGEGPHALWHVSEDDSIRCFEPRGKIWAIGTRLLPLYWFPRDCLRATFWAESTTSEEDVELAELIDRLRAMLVQGLGGGRDVQARLEPVALAGNRATALALVFSELLQNALEHGTGTVRIELVRRDGDVVLAIADEGVGAAGAAAGTGLSIVRALVADELQGSFELEGPRAEVIFPA